MAAIFKRETKSYYTGMVGYVTAAVSLFFLGLYFTNRNLMYASSDFASVLYTTTLIMLFLLPAISMCSFAEDRRNKTDQLLLTSPVSIPGIVLGKFLAEVVVFALPLTVAVIMPLILTAFGTVSLVSAFSALFAYLLLGAACLAVGGDPDRAATAAAAIEHFHSAALIHDDIADEAELRRGEPCLHLTEGLGLAINMGDLALSMVNGPVVNDPLLEDAVKVRVIKELIAMTCRTVEGQALDIGWARDGRYDITPEDYLTMAIHKTAHYSGAVPLAVGAIVGGADDEIVEALRSYGLDTGLAFQIQDDLLNLVGTDEAKKKDFRSDITEGKRTLVVVHALQNAAPEARERRDPVVEGARPGGARRGRGHHGGDGVHRLRPHLCRGSDAECQGAAGRGVAPLAVPRLARIHGRLVREPPEVEVPVACRPR